MGRTAAPNMPPVMGKAVLSRDAMTTNSFLPAIIVPISIALGILLVCVDMLNIPPAPFLTAITALVLAFFLTVIASIVSLVRLRFSSFASYLASACIGYASIIGGIYAKQAVRADRFEFSGPVHAEIAEIFRQHQNVNELLRLDVRYANFGLISLGEKCHPPSDCECWIAQGQARDLGIEREVDGWHEPISAAFPKHTSPAYFAVVSVRRIERDTYSVIGCTGYWGSLWLKPGLDFYQAWNFRDTRASNV